MGLDPSILHAEHIARLLSPAQRKAAGVQTASEAAQKYADGQEDKLQGDIRDYLNLHEIVFICPSMRKRSALPPGWPDLTFAYRGVPIVVEAKAGANTLDPDQERMCRSLVKDGWRWLLARSVADLQALFRLIDSEKQRQ